MHNKFIIGALVFLVILTGYLGYYSYTLDRQVKALGDELKVMLGEQADQVNRLNDEFKVFQGDTLAGIAALEDKVIITRERTHENGCERQPDCRTLARRKL